MTARDNQFYDAIPIILVNLIKATYINTSSIHTPRTFYSV